MNWLRRATWLRCLGLVALLALAQEATAHDDDDDEVEQALKNFKARGVSKPIAKLLYQDMYVLNAGTNGGNVTLRATSKQAGTIIYASQNAQIWLVLRPTIGTNAKAPVIGSSNLIGH